jgi:hypothetical protein
MIRLDSTTRKLEILLAGAVVTTQPSFVASWSDATASGYAGGATPGVTNGGTAVTLVAAPAASTVRDVDYVSLTNRDIAAVTATVRYNDGGAPYPITTVTLSVGDQLTYTHGSGWQVFSSTGSLKTGLVGQQGGTGPQGALGTAGMLDLWEEQDERAVSYTNRVSPESVKQTDLARGVAGNGPAFEAVVASGAAVNNALTTVTFTSETYDTGTAFTASSGVFQPSVAGYYQFNFSLGVVGTGVTRLLGEIAKNGVLVLRGTDSAVVNSSEGRSNGSCLVYMNGTTDTVILRYYSLFTTAVLNGTFQSFLARAA